MALSAFATLPCGLPLPPASAQPPAVWNFLAGKASSSLLFSQPRELPHKTPVTSNEG